MTRGQFPSWRVIHRKTLTRGRAPGGDDLHCILVAENEDVLVTVENGVGLITLNRPKAINSLTHPMVPAMRRGLADWGHADEAAWLLCPAPVNEGCARAATSS